MNLSLQTLLKQAKEKMGSCTHPMVREKALETIRRAYAEGIFVRITEGYRSHARQNELYTQGRTKPGKVVTNARGGQSYHNYGLAVDYVLLSPDGKKALWQVNSDWRRVAAIAKSLGFEWGGDWQTFKDYPHLQMTDGLSLVQLRNGAKPNLGESAASKKAPIADIQSTLVSRYGFSLKIDDLFGPETKQALLKAYQTELNKQFGANLVVDGVWGPKTSAASVTLHPGARGNLTWILQALLYCSGFDPQGMDGILGEKTVAALRSFQRGSGLKVDGLAGVATFRELFK
ncbi:peptidoglycan-binding protein [Gracilibacillus timonensis]|uniref:peptidoglycan-binding protein n=1 Tax=Gracilibacillus timonensis TaxID=1816696 RepID=UPI000824B985|nr:peptidoglycan-binding protein [Gracilibacillus timonensis]